MSGVNNGQAVDAVVTNAAFLAANGPCTGIGSICLAAPSSGVTIIDTQQTLGVLVAGVGGSQSTPATAYGAIPSNTIPSGSTHLAALIALANLFDRALGHTHNGTQGQGGPLAAVSGISCTGNPVIQGGVILVGQEYLSLNQIGNVIYLDGVPPPLSAVLAAGNSATAGINFNGGALAGVSYIDLWGTAGFPPGYPATGHVYLAASADDHVYLRTSASATHRVDTSVAVSGSSALYGDVIFVAGSGIGLAQSGQQITVSTSALAPSASVTIVGSRASPTAIPNTGIPFNATTLQTVIFVTGSGGASSPSAISAGSFVGQQLQLVGRSATATVTVAATATRYDGNGPWVGDDSSCLNLLWDGTNWLETSRR